MGPTIIMPWRTTTISYTCTHLVRKKGTGCRPFFSEHSTRAVLRSPWSTLTFAMRGNRSLMMPLNRGRSGARNLGRLTSERARYSSSSSSSWGYVDLRFPAAVMVVFTARMP